MTPEVQQITAKVAAHFAAKAHSEPRTYGSWNWQQALVGMDSLLNVLLPQIGPLLPPQVDAIATFVIGILDKVVVPAPGPVHTPPAQPHSA